MRYYSTFVTGLEEAVSELLTKHIKDVTVVALLEGAVYYETNSAYDKLQDLRFLNSTFFVLGCISGKSISIEELASMNFKDTRCPFVKDKKHETFRVFYSVENKLQNINPAIKGRVVSNFGNHNKLKFSPYKADVELWYLKRSEGVNFILVKEVSKKEELKKGQLRQDICNCMCELARPRDNDTFIDPFCGSGAIPLERSRMKGYKGIFASDSNKEIVEELKNSTKKIKQAKFNKSFFIKNSDFFETEYDEGFFDGVVTDPPWGLYKEIEADFYDKFMEKASYILKRGGRLVFLTSVDNKIKNHYGLKEVNKYGLFMSGQKVVLYVFEK